MCSDNGVIAMARRKTIAEKSLQFTGLFEAELLTQLMLRFWNHPHCADRDFANGLLESAAEILRSSIAGHRLIEELPPEQMSLVSAIWLAESISIAEDPDLEQTEQSARNRWLESLRRALPSCFCDQSLLNED